MEKVFDKDHAKKLKSTFLLLNLKAPSELPKNVPMSKEELIKIVAFLGETLKENCPNIHRQFCTGQSGDTEEEFFDSQGEFTQSDGTQSKEEEAKKEASNKESWETVRRKVCPKYKKGECGFGARGVGCKFQHPKKCKHFAKYGSAKFHPRGCKFDNKCKYLHPQLCQNALGAQMCLNKNCKLSHIVGTQRTKKQQNNINNNVVYQGSLSPGPLSHIVHPQAPTQSATQNTSQSAVHHHPGQPFLDNRGLMEQIAKLIDSKLVPIMGKMEALREAQRPTYSQVLTQ